MSTDDELYEALSDTQQRVLTALFQVSSILSLAGSLFLIYAIRRDKTRRRISYDSHHRFLIGLSAFDVLSSARHAATPNWTSEEPSPMCTFMGFMAVLIYVSPIYNVVLSFYYLATIRGGLTPKKFARRYEPLSHLVAMGYPLGVGIVGLFLKIYNPSSFSEGCTTNAFPPGCGVEEGDAECIRGEAAGLFVNITLMPFMAFGYGSLLMNNILVYLHVRKLETRSRRFHFGGSSFSKTRMVATQSFLYVTAVGISYVWPPVLIGMSAVDPQGTRRGEYYGLLIMFSVFFPLQGFMNALIYLRLRIRLASGSNRTEGSRSREKSSRNLSEGESPVRDHLSTTVPEEEHVPSSDAVIIDDLTEDSPVEDTEVADEGGHCEVSTPPDKLEAPTL